MGHVRIITACNCIENNTLQVAPNIEFLFSTAQESLTWREKQELTGFAIATVTELAKTTARATIKHEVFHRQSYQRMDATCSSFVKVTVNNRRVFKYIAKFFFYNAKAFAVVKLVHQRKMNICRGFIV